MMVQAQSLFQSGHHGGPLLLVGERDGRNHAEPSGDLLTSGAREQPFPLDVDAGVDERRGDPFREVFELVGNLGPAAGGQVEVVDLVEFTDRRELKVPSDLL